MKKPTICRYCGGIIRARSWLLMSTAAPRNGLECRTNICISARTAMPALAATRVPRGRLGDVANEILRLKRIEAHQVFDAYWQKMHISRTKAYQWLAREFKLPEEETHIGGFEIDTCQRVIDLCRAKMDKK